jgi:hypothetical protein
MEHHQRVLPYSSFYYYHLLISFTHHGLLYLRQAGLLPEQYPEYSYHDIIQPFSYVDANIIVILLHLMLQAVVLLLFFRRAAQALPRWYKQLLGVTLAVCMTFITPITFFHFKMLDPLHPHFSYYYGYIMSTVYHNPTVIVLKPLALLLFLQTAAVLRDDDRFSLKNIILLVILALLSTFAKPVYAVCYLPVICALVAYLFFYAHERKKALVLAIGAALPLLLFLGWQYHLTIQSGGEGSTHIMWAPFVVELHYSHNLLLKLLLSLAFPLAVYLCFRQSARRLPTLNLAWGMLGVGMFYMYFMAESGEHEFDGNWIWGAQVALFILYALSAGFLVTQTVPWKPGSAAKAPVWFCWTLFALHTIAGILWCRWAMTGYSFRV